MSFLLLRCAWMVFHHIRQSLRRNPMPTRPRIHSLPPCRASLTLTLLIAIAAAAVPASAQTIRVRADGLLEIADAPPDTVVRYTLDGTEPVRDSGVWLAPVEVPAGYTVKARAFTADHAPAGETVTWTPPASSANGSGSGPRIASTLVPVTQGRDWRVYDWPKRHAAIVALMKTRQPEIVMLGDSIIHFWGGEPGGEGVQGRNTAPEVWDRAFAGRRVVNLGYGWDRTENVLWRLRNGEFEGVSPKVVVIMIGTNNVKLNTVDEIAAGVTAIVDEVHQRSRTSRILLLGIFPRGPKPDEARATVDAVNQRIAKLDGRDGVVTYLDIGPRFLEADGSISKDVMYDFLHPSAKGYEIWVEAMKPALTRLLAAR
jgi:lysophospholipase L1-like esterase